MSYAPLRSTDGGDSHVVAETSEQSTELSNEKLRDEDLSEIEMVTFEEASEESLTTSVTGVASTASTATPAELKHAQAKQSLRGLLLMLTASLFFSLMALLVTSVAATGVPTFELVFFRSIVGFVISVLYLYFTDSTLIGAPRYRPLLILRGVLGTVSVRFPR